MVNGVLVASAGMIFPGLGYYLQGKTKRGSLATASILSMLFTGALLGGRFYSLFELHEGFLTTVFSLCNMGLGFLYFLLEGLGMLTADHSNLPTSEYGNVFLMLSGLVNYLLVLDSFDAKIGRNS